MRQITKTYGLRLEDLITENDLPKKLTRQTKTKRRRKVPPKYQNPHNQNETWTGRGKKPLWAATALLEGLTLDDLKIQ